MGILDRISSGIQAAQDWWADDTVMFGKSNSRKVLNNSAVQRNIQNEQMKENIVNETLQGDINKVLEKEAQREQVHQEQIKSTIAEAQHIAETQTMANADKQIVLRRNQLANEAKQREIERQTEINQIITSESFNFYKVRDLLKEGLTLQDALTSAGCQENYAYELDYQGRVFIRLGDQAVDNVATTVYQNLNFNKFLETKNAVTMMVGYPNNTNFSICCLVYDKKFGFLLIKNDKYTETYATEDVNDLKSWGILKEKLPFDRIPLSKTFIKIAAPCAICVNTQYGVETEEDLKHYEEMTKFDAEAGARFRKAITHFDLHIN